MYIIEMFFEVYIDVISINIYNNYKVGKIVFGNY